MSTTTIHSVSLLSHQAPVHVETVTLLVRDLDRMARFYRDVIGLEVMRDASDTVSLGNDGVMLIILKGNGMARPGPQAPGLFHTAFLLPERKHLGEWLRGAARHQWRIDGAADHLVSEAVYLNDPEGNGIEIYVDRPPSAWTYDGKRVRMANVRLDMSGLMNLADGDNQDAPYRMPSGARIGHVHLCVNTLEQASEVLEKQWALDEMCRFSGATFFSWGGYHHHIAANVWHASGATTREQGQAGLDSITLAARDPISRKALAQRWLSVGGVDMGDEMGITTLSGLQFRLAA